jgi:hypothetical protein
MRIPARAGARLKAPSPVTEMAAAPEPTHLSSVTFLEGSRRRLRLRRESGRQHDEHEQAHAMVLVVIFSSPRLSGMRETRRWFVTP